MLRQRRDNAVEKRERVLLEISQLDRLLDISVKPGGLLLPLNPREGDEGGCNIVIRGRPGTGKSTLALQIARAIAVCKAVDRKGNRTRTNYFAVYASLENAPEAIVDHAKDFGWVGRTDPPQAILTPIDCLQDLEDKPSQPRLADALEFILRRCPNASKNGGKCVARGKVFCDEDCEIQPGEIDPQVLFPKLSPRSLRPDLAASDELFWRRYYELENLLNAAAWLHEKKPALPELKLVVVDSLNVFGDRPLDREELFRLFDLFTRHGVVGVFVAEEREFDMTPSSPHLQYNTVEYLADVVIAMQSKAAEGYQLQTISVVKSRYQRHSHEEHPFRIFPDHLGIEDKGIVIYPSLHAVMRRSRSGKQKTPESGYAEAWPGYWQVQLARDPKDEVFQPCAEEAIREAQFRLDQVNAFRFHPDWIKHRIAAAEGCGYILGDENKTTGYSGFGELDRLGDFHPKSASCVAVVGESATFKSSIGRNFALRATVCGYQSIIITFGDRLETEQFGDVIEGDHPRRGRFEFSYDVFWDDEMKVKPERWDGETAPRLEPVQDKGLEGLKAKTLPGNRLPGHKVQKKYFYIDGHEDSSLFGSLAAMNFVPGMLFPEEFIAELQHEIGDTEEETRRRGVKRVVIDDVSRIGISYPLLEKSPTGGELFLTCLIDLLKSRGIDVMLVSSMGEEPSCNMITQQVMALADAVVRCRFYDVFGQRYVGITGESSGRSSGLTRAVTPGVIERTGKSKQVLRINNEILGGLVGFETGQIQRPGVSLYVFQENSYEHKRYNRNLNVLLHRAFCQPFGRIDSSTLGRQFGYEPVARDAQTPVIHRQSDVSVEVFDSDDSGAVHESLDVLRDKPIDRTLVVTVDEFWTEKEGEERSLEDLTDLAKELRFIPSQRSDGEWAPGESLVPLPLPLSSTTTEGMPYYGNVLLLAYRKDLIPETEWHSWQQVSTYANRALTTPLQDGNRAVTSAFEFDRTAEETLSCILLDMLIDAARQTYSYLGPELALITALRDGLDEFRGRLRVQESMVKSEERRRQLVQKNRALGAEREKLLRADMRVLLNDTSAHLADQPVDRIRAEDLKQYLADDLGVLDLSDPCCNAQLQRLVDLTRGAAVNGLLTRTNNLMMKFPLDAVDLLKKACAGFGNPVEADLIPPPPLSPDAAVYCCWYSQLRELVRTYHDLAPLISVVPMPSRGFRGDWFLGVAKGSVSIELGKQLVKTLCSEGEEYERFVHGVGLPTRNVFSNKLNEKRMIQLNDRLAVLLKGRRAGRTKWEFAKAEPVRPGFMAWQGATCSLDDVLDIHRNALSRSAIPGYRDFRTLLVTLFKQLTGFGLPGRSPDNVLAVLGPMVTMFQRNLSA